MKQPDTMNLRPVEPVEQQDRVTLVLQVTCETVGERAVSVRAAGDLILQSVGRPACQLPRLPAKTEWTKVGTGWIDRPGLVVVENLERQRPSQRAFSQRVARSGKVLLVCQAAEQPPQDLELAWRVEPGLAVPFFLNCGLPLWIRAVEPPVLYRVTAAPV